MANGALGTPLAMPTATGETVGSVDPGSTEHSLNLSTELQQMLAEGSDDFWSCTRLEPKRDGHRFYSERVRREDNAPTLVSIVVNVWFAWMEVVSRLGNRAPEGFPVPSVHEPQSFLIMAAILVVKKTETM